MSKKPLKPVGIRLPESMIEELKTMAAIRHLSGYQALVREYAIAGLARDVERFGQVPNATITWLIEGLKQRGVSIQIIEESFKDALSKTTTSKQ